MGVGTFQGASVPLPALASQQLGNREMFSLLTVCVCVYSVLKKKRQPAGVSVRLCVDWI